MTDAPSDVRERRDVEQVAVGQPISDDLMPPSAPAHQPRSRRSIAPIVLLVALLAVAGVVGVRVSGARQNLWAAQWDPRVGPIVQFVEHSHGAKFTHPVHVDFLSKADFTKRMAGDSAPSKQDERTAALIVGQMRALGLVSGELDLLARSKQFNDESTVGFYEFKTKHLYVRGTDLTPYVRSTLAHELTHALQDQRFDITKVMAQADSGAQEATTALVEGDAMWVQSKYEDAFSSADHKLFDDEQSAIGKSLKLDGIPAIISDSFQFPYAFGLTFVRALEADGGRSAIDRAFDRPPVTDAEVLSPTRYLAGTPVSVVKAPPLPPGDKTLDKPADFGLFSLLEVLGTPLGSQAAWSALEGWEGDRSIGYTHDGKSCIAIRTAFATEANAQRFSETAQKWAVAGSTHPTITRSGSAVDLRSCDPGSGGKATTAVTPSIMDALQMRGAFLETMMTQYHYRVNAAQCVADQVITVFAPAELARLNEEPSAANRAIFDRLTAATAPCREMAK